MNTEKAINKHEEAQIKLESSLSGFLRNLTTISLGFLGLLIGLKPTKIENYNAKIFFLITLGFLGLGIIFCVISQFYPVYKNKWEVSVRREILLASIKGKGSPAKFMNTPWYFWLFERMAYLFLGLALVFVIVYVCILELS